MYHGLIQQRWVCAMAGIFAVAMSLWGAPLSPRLAALAGTDTTCLVWVVFSDRGPLPAAGREAAPRALARRRRVGFGSPSSSDRLIRGDFVATVRTAGGSLRHIFRWGNAASFSIHASRLNHVATLPCVAAVIPVRTFQGAEPVYGRLSKGLEDIRSRSVYGAGLRQLEMMNVPLAHEYIRRRFGQAPGTGVLLGFFDTAFWLGHPCFAHVRAARAVIADSDFVAHDGDAGMMSVTHGAQTMSLVAAYTPGALVGVAWDSRFVLARTENETVERHVEEDNWAAALVWAESLGVDIVNSSLGYRYGFDPPDTDYTFADMDGRTTIVARATEGALARGVIVVNSAGNQGGLGAGSLNSPADAPDVVAVGAVDSLGEIAWFSSRGPTADGRVKPDVVAMGQEVLVIDGDGGYARGSGTSFSSPLVAGVFALVRQCHPALAAQELVARVFVSSRFAPLQESVDNVYGRGIPDALAACMADNEIFVIVQDPMGGRVNGAVVETMDGGMRMNCDTAGTAVLTPGGLPVHLRIFAPGGDTLTVSEGRTPALVTPTLRVWQNVRLEVSDHSGRPLVGAVVAARPVSVPLSGVYETGPDGAVEMRFHTTDTIVASVRAAGCVSSDTLRFACLPACTVRVVMQRPERFRFVLFPAVIRPDQGVTVEFVYERNAQSLPWVASVRTASGVLVWLSHGNTPVGEPLRVTYDCRSGSGARLTPGTYIFVMQCGGETRIRKFMVIG